MIQNTEIDRIAHNDIHFPISDKEFDYLPGEPRQKANVVLTVLVDAGDFQKTSMITARVYEWDALRKPRNTLV